MNMFRDYGATIPKQRIILDPDHGTFCHPMDSADQDSKMLNIALHTANSF